MLARQDQGRASRTDTADQAREERDRRFRLQTEAAQRWGARESNQPLFDLDELYPDVEETGEEVEGGAEGGVEGPNAVDSDPDGERGFAQYSERVNGRPLIETYHDVLDKNVATPGNQDQQRPQNQSPPRVRNQTNRRQGTPQNQENQSQKNQSQDGAESSGQARGRGHPRGSTRAANQANQRR